MHLGVGSLGGVYDFLSTLIQDRVIVCFHTDANDFHRQNPTNYSG